MSSGPPWRVLQRSLKTDLSCRRSFRRAPGGAVDRAVRDGAAPHMPGVQNVMTGVQVAAVVVEAGLGRIICVSTVRHKRPIA